MSFYSYSDKHDVTSNFLYLASTIVNAVNYSKHYGNFAVFNQMDLLDPNYNLINWESEFIWNSEMKYFDIKNTPSIKTASSEDKIIELYNVLTYKFRKNVITEENFLLSRYFFSGWRQKVNEYITNEVHNDPGKSIDDIKENLVGLLNELRFRTGNDYTINVNHIKRDGLYFGLYQEELSEEEIRFKEEVLNVKHGPDCYLRPELYSIEEDMDYIISLDEKLLGASRIELTNNFKKENLIDLIIRILKEKRYCNSTYEKQFDIEIQNFANHILVANQKLNSSLKFVTNEYQRLNFARIFLSLKYLGYIKSTKGQIEEMLAETFNRSKRSFQDLTNFRIEKEIKIDKGISFIINDFLQHLK